MIESSEAIFQAVLAVDHQCRGTDFSVNRSKALANGPQREPITFTSETTTLVKSTGSKEAKVPEFLKTLHSLS